MFSRSRRLFLLTLALLALPAVASPAQAQKADDEKQAKDAYVYKGVQIGMPMDEARKKLGDAMDKSDKQDFFVFADGDETVQVFYDAAKKVSAVAVVYTALKGAPDCRSVLSRDCEVKADGSQYLRLSYKPDMWVSYSRTAGDAPIVSVTMAKKQ